MTTQRSSLASTDTSTFFFLCEQKLEKTIPDQPANVVPVQLRTKQTFADKPIRSYHGKPFSAASQEGESAQQ